MMMRGFVFFLGLLAKLSLAQEPCIPPTGKPNCVCDTPGGTIDLSSLSNTDGTARYSPSSCSDILCSFSNIPQSDGTGGFTYSYNPCVAFNGDGACAYGNAAACQSSTDSDNNYMLGDASAETMYTDSDNSNNYLQYDNGDDNRVTKVYLVCDQNADSPSITADGDTATPLEYIYHLTTKCACPGGCGNAPVPSEPPPNHGGGGGGKEASGKHPATGIIGIVLVIVTFIAFVTYFIVGAVISNRLFKKEGAAMIPQKDLWFNLPFLVKDGCVFTFKPLVMFIKRKAGKGGGDDYESLK